jgi:L1 cell adhesion molecule like protein
MQGDVFGVVVPRNTPIPTNKSRTFTTVEDNQTTVTFPVYEGERTQCRDNRLLGEFELTGIPPMPRGQAELVTTFEVDANGLLKVSAMDRASGRKASISKSLLILLLRSYNVAYTDTPLRHHQLRRPSLICGD